MERSTITDSKEFLEKIKLKTKFEIALVEWNPKFDLLALGSKDGDLMVKRYPWKTGWKKNFSRQQPLTQFSSLIADDTGCSSNKSFKDTMVSLCWSPNGQILLAAFSSGQCFYLDTQNGNVLFLRLLESEPKEIRWLKYRPSGLHVQMEIEFFSKISATDFNFCDDASKEHSMVCDEIEKFCKKSFNQSHADTFLCVLREINDEDVDETHSLVLDILADGVLPILTINLTHVPVKASISSIKTMEFRKRSFRLLLKMDDNMDNLSSNKQSLLELAEPISRTRMCIYNQISKSLCWISFACIYLQEMLKYCTSNWQQSSEAFHQRVFAIVNNNKPAGILTESMLTFQQNDGNEGALIICKDLLMLIEAEQSSDLLNKFFNSPTTYKETKQAFSFLEDFSTLIKGITTGLLPATQQLRQKIRTLHAYLTILSTNMEDENEEINPASMLLDTLLQIASGHKEFSLSLDLTQNFHQFLDKFEHSAYLLEERLVSVLKVAEDNRKELEQFLHWLLELIRDESGDDCGGTDESKFDVKTVKQFLYEVVKCSGLNDFACGRCILDRIFTHLVPHNIKEKTHQLTIEQQMQICFQHFRIFFKGGIMKIINMPEKFKVLLVDKEDLDDKEESSTSDE